MMAAPAANLGKDCWSKVEPTPRSAATLPDCMMVMSDCDIIRMNALPRGRSTTPQSASMENAMGSTAKENLRSKL